MPSLRALTLLLLVGCATSPLIERGDKGFAQAQAQLAQTVARVEKLAASPEEAASFLQAESFYRYRWTFRLHDARAYALQTVAAAFDFGPFAAAAASNGVADLRLQAYDGASQLYEAHLVNYPQGRLVPYALWRLGWSYRAGQTSGFARGSDQALQALIDSQDPLLTPLARQAMQTPWKSQRTAVAWSIVPGLGQIYAGEPGNGAIRLLLAAASTVLFALPLAAAVRQDDYTWQRLTLSTAGFIALQVSYVTAFQDAQRAALDYDERQEAAFFAAHPDAP